MLRCARASVRLEASSSTPASDASRHDLRMHLRVRKPEPKHLHQRSPVMEEDDDRHVERTTTQARQAVIVKPMRYVLGLSLLGVIIAFLVAWLVIGY